MPQELPIIDAAAMACAVFASLDNLHQSFRSRKGARKIPIASVTLLACFYVSLKNNLPKWLEGLHRSSSLLPRKRSGASEPRQAMSALMLSLFNDIPAEFLIIVLLRERQLSGAVADDD